MEMAKCIISIFKHYLPIIMGWGLHNPVAVEKGLHFKVEGYLHKGMVEVLYNEVSDLFVVRLFNPDGSVKHTEEGIYLDNLVDVVDGLVERCKDYSLRVKETYGLV